MAGRERLGRRAAFSHREYVYRTRDCFEIDEVEGYDVARKRVFFDDVVLVTRHRFVPWAPAILSGLLAALLGLATLGLLSEGGASEPGARTFGIVLLALTLALGTLTVLLFAVGGEAVTIQGKRTQARMDFVLRRGKAVEVYRRACRLARERQERLKRQAVPPSGTRPGQPSAGA
jgi:hypothetical protein